MKAYGRTGWIARWEPDFPYGIEQDLAWRIDSNGGGRMVVSHTSETTGKEPTLQQHFFERVRPIVESALRENDRSRWPLIILHFDVKDNRPELHRAVWSLVGECEGWITTARKTADPHELTPFDPKPLLALTEDNGAQENVFFKDVPVGAKLRVFGSAHTNKIPALPTRAGARRRHSSFRGPIRVRPVLRADQCFRTLACVICGRLSLSRLGARQRL
jgi:hypothetical protein